MHSDNTEDFSKSWTDDLPKCKNTGVGTSFQSPLRSATIYNSRKARLTQDRYFNCEVDDKTCLYAVGSGHNGSKVAELAIQRIAAEIILGQLIGKKTDEEVRDVLRQAFESVEKCYQDSIDGLLASKAILQCHIADNTGNHQEIRAKLQAIERELSIGASAALCLIYNSKLYICNVGTCRVLLCRNDENKAPRVIQFSVDHNLYNEDEILRLRQIGADVGKLKRAGIFATRSIGYYVGKGGFKESDIFESANEEPIISQPEIVGGITIDASFQFLVLLSSGTCKYLEEIYSGDTAQENREIIKMCAKEFQCRNSLTEIAQSVVNHIIQDFENATQVNPGSTSNTERDDVTLLLRNFHQKRGNQQVTFNSLVEQINDSSQEDTVISEYATNDGTVDTVQYTDTTTTISSTSEGQYKKIFDENRKIAPYVDFSGYYANVEQARLNGTLPKGIEFD